MSLNLNQEVLDKVLLRVKIKNRRGIRNSKQNRTPGG
jgi:hypothetical protein